MEVYFMKSKKKWSNIKFSGSETDGKTYINKWNHYWKLVELVESRNLDSGPISEFNYHFKVFKSDQCGINLSFISEIPKKKQGKLRSRGG